MNLLSRTFFNETHTAIFLNLALFDNTFDSIDSATRARENLSGCDIYSGCCSLKIDFAKVSDTPSLHFVISHVAVASVITANYPCSHPPPPLAVVVSHPFGELALSM